MLSDTGIRHLLDLGLLRIDPLDDGQVQPASVDLRLGRSFRVIDAHAAECIDPYTTEGDLTREVVVNAGPFVLHPGQFVLATTVETVTLPNDLVGQLGGKSSLARWGLAVHSTAGFIDPGFHGTITLELSNVAPLPIKLWPGMRIGQISFTQLDQPAERPYGHPAIGSKYQGQRGATPSEYHRNTRGNA